MIGPYSKEDWRAVMEEEGIVEQFGPVGAQDAPFETGFNRIITPPPDQMSEVLDDLLALNAKLVKALYEATKRP